MRVQHPALGLGTLLLVSALTSTALANDVYATGCAGPTDMRTVFAEDEQVCVAGDVDFTCPVRIIELPAADVYVVLTGTDPFGAVPIHFETLGGFGGFWDETVMSPPLAPGVYDILLDEHCDGLISSDDVLRVAAFRVGGPLMCSMPPGPPTDPALPSGSTCRGACGLDCSPACTPTGPTTVCEDDAATCEHIECTQTGQSCGTHDGCRTHDDCYDACAASGGGFLCYRGCDLDCVDSYGLNCFGWAGGDGPFDGTLTFSNPPTSSGVMPGMCSGGGC